MVLALFASILSAKAQTVERTFYIDYGQNNVSGQGYKTVGADKNGHYWNNIFGKGTGAPDKDDDGLQVAALVAFLDEWLYQWRLAESIGFAAW